eukprot:361274-Chlamydomonas_euryale.AAC.8
MLTKHPPCAQKKSLDPRRVAPVEIAPSVAVPSPACRLSRVPYAPPPPQAPASSSPQLKTAPTPGALPGLAA